MVLPANRAEIAKGNRTDCRMQAPSRQSAVPAGRLSLAGASYTVRTLFVRKAPQRGVAHSADIVITGLAPVSPAMTDIASETFAMEE